MAIKTTKVKPTPNGRHKRPEHGPGAAPIHISRVELSGVRIFEHLAFDLPTPASADEGQWIVLLGENGTGKTTLLRALALAFAEFGTAIYSLTPVQETSTLIGGSGAGVVVSASDREYSFTSSQVSARPVFTHRTAPDPRASSDVFAYGSTRGVTGHLVEDIRPVDDLNTLFEPRRGLVDVQAWLRWATLERRRRAGLYDLAARAVASILPGGEQIEMDGAAVLLRPPVGAAYPLAAASDGYLTTIRWVIDLIARWVHRYGPEGLLDGDFAKDMPCVVLVDEIDLHLHPRWQLDIIPRLRKAFPKTTFIVTTHNPLTLQGTRPGEVFVLQRDDEGKVTIAQRDVPPGIDASRLLTGDWFGLASTLDEDTLQAMDEHRALLWKGAPETDPRRRALEARLRERLGRFADTSLERLAQSVAVEVLHRHSPARPRDVTEAQRDEIVKKVEERLASRESGRVVAREAAAPYPVARKGKATAKRAAPVKQRRPTPGKRR